MSRWFFWESGGGHGFVRVFGFGLHWSDTSRHRKLWSDREGLYHQVEVGAWLLTPLIPGRRGIRRRAPRYSP